MALRKICLLFTSIYSNDFLTCKLQKADLLLLIANMNHCLSLGLTKTDYECVLTMRVIPHNSSLSEI